MGNAERVFARRLTRKTGVGATYRGLGSAHPLSIAVRSWRTSAQRQGSLGMSLHSTEAVGFYTILYQTAKLSANPNNRPELCYKRPAFEGRCRPQGGRSDHSQVG